MIIRRKTRTDVTQCNQYNFYIKSQAILMINSQNIFFFKEVQIGYMQTKILFDNDLYLIS